MTRRIQQDRVLDQLRYDAGEGHGTCGNVLLQMRVPRYGGRVYELRHDRGFGIQTQRCTRHHHEGNVAEYVLTDDPERKPRQLSLLAS